MFLRQAGQQLRGLGQTALLMQVGQASCLGHCGKQYSAAWHQLLCVASATGTFATSNQACP